MKLVYFNGRGLAETSRLILAWNNVEYEDFRYPLKIIDWSTHTMVKDEFDKDKNEGKLTNSLGKVPFLVDNGETISQSKSIERYLASKYNMMGTTPTEFAKIDSICEYVRDFKDMYQKVRQLKGNERTNGMNVWFKETLVEKLEILDNILSDNDEGYSVGSKSSLADIVLFSFITQFFDDAQSAIDSTKKAPKLCKIIEKIRLDKNIKTWVSIRPITDF